jgi:hypothetical protein
MEAAKAQNWAAEPQELIKTLLPGFRYARRIKSDKRYENIEKVEAKKSKISNGGALEMYILFSYFRPWPPDNYISAGLSSKIFCALL